MFMLSDQEFLDEMLRKVAVRYKSESDFMRAMHRSPQNMTNWKKRGVPAEMKPVIARELDIDWLEEGKNKIEDDDATYIDDHAMQVLADLRRMASGKTINHDDLDLLLIIARHLSHQEPQQTPSTVPNSHRQTRPRAQIPQKNRRQA